MSSLFVNFSSYCGKFNIVEVVLLGSLYDRNFVNISGGLHGFAVEMPTSNWKNTYGLSSRNVRVSSYPGVFRAVVLGESEEEILQQFHMIVSKVVNDDIGGTSAAVKVPLLRRIIYDYLENRVIGEISPYVVSSVKDLSLDDIDGSFVIIPAAETLIEMKYPEITGVLLMKLWFVPIGKMEDILYLIGILPAFAPDKIVETVKLPNNIDIPDVLRGGVLYERIGNTFIIASWLVADITEKKKMQSFMDHVFSIHSANFLPSQLVKSDTLDIFKEKLYLSLAIEFNRPASRLLALMNFTSSTRSKILPNDIVELVSRMDLIGFKRMLRIVRTSPVKDIVVSGVES